MRLVPISNQPPLLASRGNLQVGPYLGPFLTAVARLFYSVISVATLGHRLEQASTALSRVYCQTFVLFSVMAPVNDVFSMEMLLCFILQYLEPGDILRCRRVCSYFNQVIQTSSMAKRACYQLSIASSETRSDLLTEAEDVMNPGGHTINPTLQKRFPQFFSVAKDNRGLWGRWEFSTSAVGTRIWRAVVDGGASWRNMLVAQPPITRLDVLYITPTGGIHRYTCRHETLHYPGGLTMSVLYEIILEHLKQPSAGFALDWSGALAGTEETYDIGILAYPDGRMWHSGRGGGFHPPPMYPPAGIHQIDLSAASVTVLLQRPGWRAPAPPRRADRLWYEKWSLKPE